MEWLAWDELAIVTPEQWEWLRNRIKMQLTEDEIKKLQQQTHELKSVCETNDELRKLMKLMIAELRRQAINAEDIMKQCYHHASTFEDKLRTL